MKWKTAISKISDGKEIIRGLDLQELIREKSFVETIYLVLKGKLPKKQEARMLNALFTAGIDHGVGAPSTTVARTVASTGNSLHAAAAAGVLAMGELHGGAIEGAAKFFQEHLGNFPRTPSWKEGEVEALVRGLKDRKVKIPGYGHKVLTHDHRVDTLFKVAKETGFYGEHCKFAESVGAALNKISSKKLPLNVDGAMAAVVADMGFDWRLAKGFFIISRMPGLVAHIYEELVSGEGIKRIDEEDIEYLGS